MSPEKVHYAALYRRYSLGRRLSLIMNSVVLRVISWTILLALILSFAPFVVGLFGQDDKTDISTAVAGVIFTLVFISPFIVMVIVLIRIITDRAVKSDRIQNFAHANGFSYQQLNLNNFGAVNPFWVEGESQGYQDTVAGTLNGKEFWVTGMMHFSPPQAFVRSRIYYTVVCAIGGVNEERVSPLAAMYKDSEVKIVNSTAYVSYRGGISYKSKDYQRFFETLEAVTLS